MIERIPITVVCTTWAPDNLIGLSRVNSAFEAVNSWKKNLMYEGDLRLHIGDDGSEYPGYGLGIGSPPSAWWGDEKLVSFSRQERKGIGASLNAGFSEAHKFGPITLYLVDDLMLAERFDLTPWVRLLVESDTIGCVRLGPPHPELYGNVVLTPHGWVLSLDKYGYTFSFRPALYHKRFFDVYGWFSEGTSALECERLYNEHFSRVTGSLVAYALPYPWVHLGAEDKSALSAIEPGRKGCPISIAGRPKTANDV